jgi:hypothetical protein
MSSMRSFVCRRSACSFRLAFTGALALFVAAAGPACSGTDPFSPGKKLGTFRVTAKLTQTSCGATPNPWEFDVRLNHDGSTLYWVQGGALPIESRVDATARTTMEAQLVEEVRPADAKAQRDACSIARTDTLALTLLGADARPTSDPGQMTAFSGGLVYTFAATAGSDCLDQLTASGGGYAALNGGARYPGAELRSGCGPNWAGPLLHPVSGVRL